MVRRVCVGRLSSQDSFVWDSMISGLLGINGSGELKGVPLLLNTVQI